MNAISGNIPNKKQDENKGVVKSNRPTSPRKKDQGRMADGVKGLTLSVLSLHLPRLPRNWLGRGWAVKVSQWARRAA